MTPVLPPQALAGVWLGVKVGHSQNGSWDPEENVTNVIQKVNCKIK